MKDKKKIRWKELSDEVQEAYLAQGWTQETWDARTGDEGQPPQNEHADPNGRD